MHNEEKLIDFIRDVSEEKWFLDKGAIVNNLERLLLVYNMQDRHSYSEVTQFVFEIDDESYECLDNNLKELSQFIETAQGRRYDSIKEKVKKLIDHISLAKIQKQYIEDHYLLFISSSGELMEKVRLLNQQNIFLEKELKKINYEFENTKEMLTQAQSDLAKAQKRVQETEDRLSAAQSKIFDTENSISETLLLTQNQISKHGKDINEIRNIKNQIFTQFVTILGIFTTIVFASFGGLQMLSNVINNLQYPIGKLLMFFSLILTAIVSLLFILMTTIGRLTDRNIRSCGCDSDNCRHNVIQKYPIFTFLLLACMFLFFIGVSAIFVDYNEFYKHIVHSMKLTKQVWLVTIILITLLIIMVSTYLFMYFRKPRQSSQPSTSVREIVNIPK